MSFKIDRHDLINLTDKSMDKVKFHIKAIKGVGFFVINIEF